MNHMWPKPKLRVYDFIVSYKQENNGNSPSVREIGQACDISSTSMVRYYLDGLMDDGLITMRSFTPRSIEVIGGQW